MSKTQPKTYALISLLDRMIADMISGKKLQSNGNRYRPGTIDNYQFVRNNLAEFSLKKQFELRIRPIKSLGTRDLIVEKNYWGRFYRKFSEFMYSDKGAFDNYVGMHFKIIRAFFNYLQKDVLIDPGQYYKHFHIYKEDIPIIVLSPERLNFLIYDQAFDQTLTTRLKRIKDIFVFGCTVALRYSDLQNLKYNNILKVDNSYYLSARSQKTKTLSQVKLPDYAIQIIKVNRKRSDFILPQLSSTNFNKGIKELIALAGWNEPIGKTRERRGITKKVSSSSKAHRFCDLVTAHTMRRTAITTMLILGVPEVVVRSVSGHAAGSKEFYKYVALAQVYKDREVEQMHEKLRSRQLQDNRALSL